MLTIRKEQVERFGEFIEESYKVNSIKRLRDKYPQETNGMDDNKMMDFLHLGINNAEKHNIIERRDIYVYLEYMLVYGENFDTDPENDWAKKILGMKDISGEEKIIHMLSIKPL